MYNRIIIACIALFSLTACVVDPKPPIAPAPIVNGWKQSAAEDSNYRVQPDDSIYSIAWAFGMDYRDLARYNHLSEPYQLQIGQMLRMSPSAQAAQPVVTAQPSVGVTYASSNAASTAARLSVQTKNQQVPRIPLASETTKTAAPVSASAAATTTTTTIVATPWVWPTKGKVASSFSAVNGSHGIDIAGKTGQPVVAASLGKVVYAGSGLKGYGKLIIIKHNDNDLSAYAFNQSLAVKEGDAVKTGQKIATMGRNENGQPMLHFEIRRNGKPVNPLPYLGS